MVNYANGKIYTIRCRSDDTLIYVGSTTRALSQRMTEHRCNCKRGDSCSLYDYIVNDDWSEWFIELVQNFPCNSKEELLKKEGEIIRQIATINKRIAGRSRKGWLEDNVEKFKEITKKYRENNVEKLKEKNKEYYKNNVEKFKENQKNYYENNVEKIKEYIKEYYVQNAEKLKERNKEKVCCNICGAFMRKNGLGRHQKTKKCMDVASKKEKLISYDLLND